MLFHLLLTTFPLAIALPPQTPIVAHADDRYNANLSSAKKNANLVFNALHSSMRQWGSSLQHNGMSFFPVTVPEGTLFYHGTSSVERAKGPEWLAFEIEHAEAFARSRGPRRPPGKDGTHQPPHLLGDDHGGPPRGPPRGPGGQPGYLHVYQATKPMKRLLYLDGMSAGKSDLGTLDTQDLVLLDNFTGGAMSDSQRARELCNLGNEWNVEGFLRMEAGFEIIKCDFEDGLEFVSHNQRPVQDNPEGYAELHHFEYIRAVTSRYHGIDGGRVIVDYSSMVSAFFYPTNLTNPSEDPRQTLPRLSSSSAEQISQIKADVKEMMDKKKTNDIVDWQGIVDMINTRYSDRLQYMASRPPIKPFLSEINLLLNAYIDYGNPSIEGSITACSNHYLRPVKLSTDQDRLIFASVYTVSHRICKTLFEIREDLLEKEGALPENDLAGPTESIHKIRELNEWLDWNTFRTCGTCQYNEVCYVAVWPFGNSEDHYHPRCKNNTEIGERDGEQYWHLGPGRPLPPKYEH
ncbi:hypothetical protein PVAG01_00496 [Phlyctema vagabunda]|uniref:Uncharacterized protein n=1 Tax=Phlyctema vagabunda TaxID=108571 RepID=A0ABR4PUF0_9HELO